MADDFGVYVHIPWCRRRCPYCAFAISTISERPTDAYTDAVSIQWAAEATHFPGAPTSVAFGGGTPSLHPPGDIARLIRLAALAPGAEVSLEANPEDVNAPLLEALRGAGVTRLSLGVQSFEARSARLLNRAHSVARGPDRARLVAAAGFESWSLDLIFAQPGQSLAAWATDLEAALALAPPHLSLYGLAAEEGKELQ